jgi:hypothetical protein
MTNNIDLIYCASGNKRFAQIAVDTGFLYGAQLPGHVSQPLYFADQNWKRPNRTKYMNALAKHRPHIATVTDIERSNQLTSILDEAEEASQYVEIIILIPKINGIIKQLPRTINGKEIRLGYSVPTPYGGTAVPLHEFIDWPIHLLGGSPHAQLTLAGRNPDQDTNQQSFTINTPQLNIQSIDGNAIQNQATRRCMFWQPGTAHYAKNRWWPTLAEAENGRWNISNPDANAPAEAFKRSCKNVIATWGQRP